MRKSRDGESNAMNRRDFLKRMAAAGLVAASPKIIFDLGANTYKEPELSSWGDWVWHNLPDDPFHTSGFYITQATITVPPIGIIIPEFYETLPLTRQRRLGNTPGVV